MTEYYQVRLINYLKFIFRLIFFIMIAGNITLPKKDFISSTNDSELSRSLLTPDGHQTTEDNNSEKSFDPVETDIHHVLVCAETIIKLEKLVYSTDVPLLRSNYFLSFFIPPSIRA